MASCGLLRRSQRGTTIVEAMAATVILLVAATGTLGMYTQQVKMSATARHITEASAIAQDLVENIAMWDYADPRLANSNTGNDSDIGDTAFRFESARPPYDHAEADLALGTWTGLPAAALDSADPPRHFERYWNVAYPDDVDGNGVPDAVRIAVIVRWRSEAGWRRVVLMTSKVNPAEAL